MSRFSHCPTRREVLGTAALASLAATFRPLFAAAGSRWFKIGACEWSLRKAGPAAFDVAKEIGLDGIQADLGRVGDMRLLKPDVQQAYLEAAQRTGLEIASLALGVLNQVPLKRDPQAAQWLSDSLGVCRALKLKLVMPACFGQGDLDMQNTAEIDHLVKVLKEIAPRAEKDGITIGIENYLSAEDNLKILDRVGSPALKVYYDVGNSTDKGRDVCLEIRKLGPQICEFHAKDSKFMLGQGRIDFKKVRQAMDDINYSGWIHLEAAAPKGVVPDYTADKEYLRGNFPERK